MNPETLRILQAADDPEEWEAPEYFNWYESIAQVRVIKRQLESIIGRSLKIDDQVQDASYFAQLALLHSADQENQPKILLNIYFSNFGKLSHYSP